VLHNGNGNRFPGKGLAAQDGSIDLRLGRKLGPVICAKAKGWTLVDDNGGMDPLWPHTQPDIERMQVERLRQMPPWRKMELMAEMTESVRTLALAGLRQRYPTDTPAQRRRRLADLLLGPELAARAYGPPPEEG
jgi:hypothetical protein